MALNDNTEGYTPTTTTEQVTWAKLQDLVRKATVSSDRVALAEAIESLGSPGTIDAAFDAVAAELEARVVRMATGTAITGLSEAVVEKLPTGTLIQVAGQTAVGDGGSGTYRIRPAATGETADGVITLNLADGRIAEREDIAIVKLSWWGVRPDNDAATNDAGLTAALAWINSNRNELSSPASASYTRLIGVPGTCKFASSFTLPGWCDLDLNGMQCLLEGGGSQVFLTVPVSAQRVRIYNGTIRDGGTHIRIHGDGSNSKVVTVKEVDFENYTAAAIGKQAGNDTVNGLLATIQDCEFRTDSKSAYAIDGCADVMNVVGNWFEGVNTVYIRNYSRQLVLTGNLLGSDNRGGDGPGTFIENQLGTVVIGAGNRIGSEGQGVHLIDNYSSGTWTNNQSDKHRALYVTFAQPDFQNSNYCIRFFALPNSVVWNGTDMEAGAPQFWFSDDIPEEDILNFGNSGAIEVANTTRPIGYAGNIRAIDAFLRNKDRHPAGSVIRVEDVVKSSTGFELSLVGSGTNVSRTTNTNSVHGDFQRAITGTANGGAQGLQIETWLATSAVIRENTATAGTSTTVTLDAGASGTNDVYNGMWLYIVSGTGAGQVRQIADYTGATKVATVATWGTEPDNTSGYRIVRRGPCDTHYGDVVSSTDTTLVLDAYASSTDDAYNEWYVEAQASDGEVQIRRITDYVGSTKTATVNTAWDTNPDSSYKCRIYRAGLFTVIAYLRNLGPHKATLTLFASNKRVIQDLPVGETVVPLHFYHDGSMDASGLLRLDLGSIAEGTTVEVDHVRLLRGWMHPKDRGLVMYGNAVPTEGYWFRSDRIIQSVPALGAWREAVCITRGYPGTWAYVSQIGYRSGSADPTGSVTPNFTGEEYLREGTGWYKATGTTSSDWQAL